MLLTRNPVGCCTALAFALLELIIAVVQRFSLCSGIAAAKLVVVCVVLQWLNIIMLFISELHCNLLYLPFFNITWNILCLSDFLPESLLHHSWHVLFVFLLSYQVWFCPCFSGAVQWCTVHLEKAHFTKKPFSAFHCLKIRSSSRPWCACLRQVEQSHCGIVVTAFH